MAGEVDKASEILQKAYEMNPSSERVWLAASKLEWSNDIIRQARVFYKHVMGGGGFDIHNRIFLIGVLM